MCWGCVQLGGPSPDGDAFGKQLDRPALIWLEPCSREPASESNPSTHSDAGEKFGLGGLSRVKSTRQKLSTTFRQAASLDLTQERFTGRQDMSSDIRDWSSAIFAVT